MIGQGRMVMNMICRAMNVAALGGLVLGAFVLSGCPQPDGTIVEPPPNTPGCSANSDCSDGYICNGGACEIGECDPSLTVDICEQNPEDPDIGPYCCRSFETCNFSRECDSIIPGTCETSEDCPDPGQFCSGLQCYDAPGRTPCTNSFQCPAGERCDRTVFLCVDDQGGCNFCADLPELCCEADQNCDQETGFCIDVGEAECTPDDLGNCLPGQLCNAQQQCVQCITDTDCGPGTACNTGTGSCYSIINSCESDDDCTGGKRCAPASNECITPQCEGDAQCQQQDSRSLCDLNTFTCYLPSADCVENDEPNNGVGSATQLGGLTGAGTLCRGDIDYIAFPVIPNRRYRATVTFPDFNVGGNSVAMLNGQGGQEDFDTYSSFQTEVTVSAITGLMETDDTYYLRISGTGDDGDFWSYTVEIEELEAPEMVDCTDEFTNGIEPNDSFADAFELTPGQSYTFARCDQADADFYHFTVPQQNGVEVTVEFDNTAGDMAARLYNGADDGSSVDYSDGAGTDVETVVAPEGDTEFWLRVALWSTNATGVDGQPYTVTVTPQPRPAECDPDVGEPGDDTFMGAQTLPVDTATDGTRCVPADVDWYQFTIPANFGGSLALSFTHSEGDLRLDLYDDTGVALLDSSNSSNANSGVEVIELPFAAEARTYMAQVRLHSGSGQVAQAYTISASTYDASTCVASEPSPNNTMLEATCVGDTLLTDYTCASGPVSQPIVAPGAGTCDTNPETPGCGTVCGANDEDWYRVGRLNDGQALRARLQYDPGTMGENGRLGLVLARGNADLSAVTFVEYNPNTAAQGDLELSLNAATVNPAFAREYAVIVRPEGAEGFSALPYRLDIEVGDPCIPDAEETNENPSESTLIGTPGTDYDETFAKSLCGFDTDVYELFGLTGEQVTVTLNGPPDTTVNIGTRPTPITDEAVTVAAGAPVMGPCPVGDAGGDGGVSDRSCVQATFTSPGNQQLYLTVKRTTEDVSSIGDYDLQVVVDTP